MKSFLLRITILAMFISSTPCQQKVLAQVSDPLPDKKIGAAEVYYFKDKNKSRAQVRIYLQGRPEDTTAKKYAFGYAERGGFGLARSWRRSRSLHLSATEMLKRWEEKTWQLDPP
jgi:hypothetical protein